jgi:hypothetical protein
MAGLAGDRLGGVYGWVGTIFEERDLLAIHGDAYRDYRREVPMVIPRVPRRSHVAGRASPAEPP